MKSVLIHLAQLFVDSYQHLNVSNYKFQVMSAYFRIHDLNQVTQNTMYCFEEKTKF